MWSREAAERALRRAGVLLLIGAVERLLFTRLGEVPRRAARRWMTDTIETIEPAFDASLYIRLIRNGLRRRRASRDPALHYAILGWREHRAPNAQFDPRYYRDVTPDLSGEPFAHYLRHGKGVGAAQNEAESARRAYPEATTPASFTLALNHARGGGSSRFLALYEAAMVARGAYPLRLRVLSNAPSALVACEGPAGKTHLFDLDADRDRLLAFAREAGVTSILVNHVIDLPEGAFSWIVSLSRDLGAPFDVILHDYFMLCPRVNLIDFRGAYCGVAPATQCATCLKAAGGSLARIDIATWRADAVDFLNRARQVIVPSHDLRQRLAPYFSGAMQLWSPDRDETAPPLRLRPPGADKLLKIAIIGGLTGAKGRDVVLNLARAIKAAGAPIELHLVGSSDQDRRLRKAGVRITGRYREQDLASRLEEIAPHLAFIPSIWPETWSFVLTHALAAGLPTAVFDIGAPADRLRALGRTEHLIPLAFAEQPRKLMAFFMRHNDYPESDARAPSLSAN